MAKKKTTKKKPVVEKRTGVSPVFGLPADPVISPTPATVALPPLPAPPTNTRSRGRTNRRYGN